MNRRRRIAVALGLAALLLGLLLHQAVTSLNDSFRSAADTLPDLKLSLLEAGALRSLHHQVHAEVGETQWEREVKPRILTELVLRTALEEGTLLPEERDVVRWVRRHPVEARALFRSRP